MNEKLSVLIELQEIDSKINKVNECIIKINSETDCLKEALKNKKEQVENLKKESTKSIILKKEKEAEISSISDQIRKHNMELNTVKTNDAYRALMSEIENCRKAKIKIEDDLLSMMENEDKASADIKNIQNEYLRIEKEFSDKKILHENDLKKHEEDIAKLKSEKDIKLKGLPKDLASSYENLVKNKKDFAVVPIANDTCGGCHRNLPVHVIDEVRKGKDIVVCNNCLRILYQKV